MNLHYVVCDGMELDHWVGQLLMVLSIELQAPLPSWASMSRLVYSPKRTLYSLPTVSITSGLPPSLPLYLAPSLSLCFLILSRDADVQRRLRAWLPPEAGESESALQRARQPRPLPSRVLVPSRAGRHQHCLPSSSIKAVSLCLVGDRGKEALQSRAGRPESDQTNPHLTLDIGQIPPLTEVKLWINWGRFPTAFSSTEQCKKWATPTLCLFKSGFTQRWHLEVADWRQFLHTVTTVMESKREKFIQSVLPSGIFKDDTKRWK